MWPDFEEQIRQLQLVRHELEHIHHGIRNQIPGVLSVATQLKGFVQGMIDHQGCIPKERFDEYLLPIKRAWNDSAKLSLRPHPPAFVYTPGGGVYGPGPKVQLDMVQDIKDVFDNPGSLEALQHLKKTLEEGPSVADFISALDSHSVKLVPKGDEAAPLTYDELEGKYQAVVLELADARKKLKQMENDHKHLVNRQKLLIDRPDCPLERVAAWNHYETMRQLVEDVRQAIGIEEPLHTDFPDLRLAIHEATTALPPSKLSNLLYALRNQLIRQGYKPPIRSIQETPLVFDPTTGQKYPILKKDVFAKEYREHHGQVAWLYNPWTGKKRDPRDIGSDVTGLAIA